MTEDGVEVELGDLRQRVYNRIVGQMTNCDCSVCPVVVTTAA